MYSEESGAVDRLWAFDHIPSHPIFFDFSFFSRLFSILPLFLSFIHSQVWVAIFEAFHPSVRITVPRFLTPFLPLLEQRDQRAWRNVLSVRLG